MKDIKTLSDTGFLDFCISDKGQSYIIQFILFFTIGIGLFVGIGSFYRTQYDVIREDTADISIEMTSSYLSSLAVTSIGSCLGCGRVETNLDIEDTTAGYVLEFYLNDSGIAIATMPQGKGQISGINGLNNSMDDLSGEANSMRSINMTYIREDDSLQISNS